MKDLAYYLTDYGFIVFVILPVLLFLYLGAVYLKNRSVRKRAGSEKTSSSVEVSTPCKDHTNFDIRNDVFLERLPCKDGCHHTSEILHQCDRCGEAIPFLGNWSDVDPETREVIKRGLRERGWNTGLL